MHHFSVPPVIGLPTGMPVIRPPDIFGLPHMPELPPTSPMFHHYIPVLPRHVNARIENESQKQQALDECLLRLNEAAELYKKQFRKIEKLKKKLSKSSSDFMDGSSCASMSVKDPSSAAESADEAPSSTKKLSQAHNSDSDTGEHVLHHPTEDGSSCASMSVKDPSSAAESADEAPSSTKKLSQAHNSDSDTGEHVLHHPTEACPEGKEDMLNVHIICHDVG